MIGYSPSSACRHLSHVPLRQNIHFRPQGIFPIQPPFQIVSRHQSTSIKWHLEDPLGAPLGDVVRPRPRPQVEPCEVEEDVHLFLPPFSDVDHDGGGGVRHAVLGGGALFVRLGEAQRPGVVVIAWGSLWRSLRGQRRTDTGHC